MPSDILDKKHISMYVICFNEEDYIEDCIRSGADFDEIVVVDSGSTDTTLHIIQRLQQDGLPIRLIHQEWLGYAKQKQFALEQCKNDWCLCLDADERVDQDLVREMYTDIRQTEHAAFSINIMQHVYGFGYAPPKACTLYLTRFSCKSRSKYDVSVLVHEGLIVQGTIGKIKSGFIKHRRSFPITEQIAKWSHYSDLKAKQLFERGKKPRYLRLFFNPVLYFIKFYFFRRLFLCGIPGFIFSVFSGVYSFMTEARLIELSTSASQNRQNKSGS
jgi:glycosyltransferase involved in cell wall biosynthesis